MSDVKRRAVWERRHAVTAGEATLLGFTIGSAAAIVAAFRPLRDFSYNYLRLILLTIGPCAGILGYMFWHVFDPVRLRRLLRITQRRGFAGDRRAIRRIPRFLVGTGRTKGFHTVYLFAAFIFSTAAFVVGTGLGMVHLVGHLAAFSFRRSTKPVARLRTDGVWISELDENGLTVSDSPSDWYHANGRPDGHNAKPYIDAHSHIWTPDVGHYPLAAGFQVADMKPRSFTAEELLGQCRPAGVGHVNLIQMSYYAFDNRYMLDMIKLYPDRFVGTAIVDPLAVNPGAAMRALSRRGFGFPDPA